MPSTPSSSPTTRAATARGRRVGLRRLVLLRLARRLRDGLERAGVCGALRRLMEPGRNVLRRMLGLRRGAVAIAASASRAPFARRRGLFLRDIGRGRRLRSRRFFRHQFDGLAFVMDLALAAALPPATALPAAPTFVRLRCGSGGGRWRGSGTRRRRRRLPLRLSLRLSLRLTRFAGRLCDPLDFLFGPMEPV